MTLPPNQSSIDHRHTCTSDEPWSKDKSFYGDHPLAVIIDSGEDGGCEWDLCHCPCCDLQFRVWPDAV